MQEPWELYGGTAAQAPGPVIVGTPRPRQPPPVRPIVEQTDELQARDLQSRVNTNPDEEREAAARRRIAEANALEAERRAADPTGALGVEQSKATGFYSRGVAANRAYEALGVGAPPFTQTIGRYLIPQSLESYILPERREEAEANERGFITSVLRYESGAAIPPEEYSSAQRTYFPQPGDEPGTIAAKARLRAEALEALRIGSGPGAAQVQGRAPFLPPEEYQAELNRLLRSGDREAVFRFLESQSARADNPADLEAAIQGRQGRAAPPRDEVPGPGLGEQFLDAAGNAVAAVGQGVATIPDAAATALGNVMAIPADWLGFEGVADSWRDPFTIGGAIERAAPTPQDWTGWSVRQVGRFGGGAASAPPRALNALTRTIVGPVPQAPVAARNALVPRRQIMEDAAALDVPMIPADVAGPTTRILTSALAQTPAGAAPIVNASQRTVAAGERALSRIARRSGSPTNAEEAGETATAGALRYRDLSRGEATLLYDRAAQLAGDVKVVPQRAVATLDRHIAELGENPAGGEALTFLTGLRDTLTTRFPDGVTVAGVRGMRTQLRDRFFSAGLRGTDVERRVMAVVDEASDDVAEALTQAGRSEAAEVYRAADAAWTARSDVLDNVIMPIIGRTGEKSGEQVFQALQSATRGNGARVRRFMAALPEEEAGTVRASLINALGRPSAGRQNAAGDTFSLDQFLTHWSQLSPSSRATLFSRESRTAIERLARIAENTKAAASYANRSRTGGVVMTGATGYSLTGGPALLASVLAGQYVAGRLLSSPAVAKALATIGSSRSPREATAAIRSLGTVAQRNPVLAADIGELQRRLTEAVTSSPATAAAANQDE